MFPSDKEKADKCMAALVSSGLDETNHGFCVTFDGAFPKTYDATTVLQRTDQDWRFFVFERGSISDTANFASADVALNFLFWNMTRPEPNYSAIYRDHGRGFDTDDNSEELKAFLFSCNHLGVSPKRYHIDLDGKSNQVREDAWICSRLETGWRVSQDRSGIVDVIGDFEHLHHALEFMFWTLTGAETYQQRYAKRAAMG